MDQAEATSPGGDFCLSLSLTLFIVGLTYTEATYGLLEGTRKGAESG